MKSITAMIKFYGGCVEESFRTIQAVMKICQMKDKGKAHFFRAGSLAFLSWDDAMIRKTV